VKEAFMKELLYKKLQAVAGAGRPATLSAGENGAAQFDHLANYSANSGGREYSVWVVWNNNEFVVPGAGIHRTSVPGAPAEFAPNIAIGNGDCFTLAYDTGR
jgi:hypothetical protein